MERAPEARAVGKWDSGRGDPRNYAPRGEGGGVNWECEASLLTGQDGDYQRIRSPAA
jgi:hypothetical protein